MIYFGIDFGTSNSCIACFDDERETLEVISSDIDKIPGGRVYPSTVAFDKEGNTLSAGWFAHSLTLAVPNLTVDKVKLWIGRPYDQIVRDKRLENIGYKIIEKNGDSVVEVGSRTHLPEDIVAYLLNHMLSEAKTHLNRNGLDISKEKMAVIVTYPAYYFQIQVDAIREAVNKMEESSGLKFEYVRLIPEPLASVCSALYSGELSKDDRYVFVIDEGAGTLDTMLVNMTMVDTPQVGSEKVLEANGVTIGGQESLGGTNMDNYIMEWILSELRKDENINREEIKNIDYRQLRAEIEAAKIDISEGRTKVAQIRIPGFSKLVELTESKLEEVISPVIEQCKEAINKSLKEIEKQGVDKNEISKIILVGGPTRMSFFRGMVKDIIDAEIVDVNPMECVAIGAAVGSVISYKVPVDRTYGLIKKVGKDETFVKAVEKNTALPVGKILEWKVEKLAGKIPIEVAQVYDEDKTEITCLQMGKYEFRVPTPEKTYYIVFKIDEERKVEVAVTDSKTKAENYLKGVGEKRIFKLSFQREVAWKVIKKDSDEIPPEIEIFFKNVPSFASKYGYALDLIKKSDQLTKYKIDTSNYKTLLHTRNEIENIVERIFQHIITKISEIDRKDTSKMKQIAEDIIGSDDYLTLSAKLGPFEDLLDEIENEIIYDSYAIQNLAETISKTKDDTIKLLQQKRIKVPAETKEDIEYYLNELDKIQGFLEKKNEIVVNSPEGGIFREGENTSSMLRSIIDQYLSN